MSANEQMKNKSMAAYLKKNGITRATGQCPWGCGRPLKVGGAHLSSHLNTCKGPFRGSAYEGRQARAH